jgi:hypothetical protein
LIKKFDNHIGTITIKLRHEIDPISMNIIRIHRNLN